MPRTIKKTKKEIRVRRSRRILTVLVLLGVITCVVLSLTVFFPISSIEVTGEVTSYADEGLIEASGLKVGNNIFAFSQKAVERKICKQFPYIESVSVKRTLSGKITLDCYEAYDFLSLPLENDRYLILTPKLKIVEQATSNREGFAEVYGLNPASDKTGAPLEAYSDDGTTYLQYVVDALNSLDMLKNTSAINVSDKLNLSIVYDNRFFVMIGTASQLEYKMKMLSKIVTENIGEGETGYIDISVPSKATYKSGPHTLSDEFALPAKIMTKAETEK